MTTEYFNDLLSHTFTNVFINTNKDEMVFIRDDGKEFMFYHTQDCCESVTIDDVVGDLSDLVGSPITMAECTTEEDNGSDFDSCTWTFYKFATIKGYVDVKWYGESNGYYSERVDFREVK